MVTWKIFVSDTNDDDAHWKAGGPDDGSHGQVQIGDDPVSQDQEDEVVTTILYNDKLI